MKFVNYGIPTGLGIKEFNTNSNLNSNKHPNLKVVLFFIFRLLVKFVFNIRKEILAKPIEMGFSRETKPKVNQ